MSAAPTPTPTPTPAPQGRVRTITAFVQINTQYFESQITEALTVLRKAQAQFTAGGYEVETLRVTTEPFEDYASGVPQAQSLAFLKQLNDLAAAQKCVINIGPAMLNDTDDPTPMTLLQEVLCTLPNLEASAVIADTNGIHWKTIALTADLILYVSRNSPNGQGNFNFSALAMQDPYSALVPGSWFNDEGEQFGIAFQCTDAVNAILLKDKGDYVTATTDLTALATQQYAIPTNVVLAVQKDTSWAGGAALTNASNGGASIAAGIEAYTGEKFGAPGTLTALRLIAGANLWMMLPVMQDKLLAQRWAESAFTLDSLFSYSAAGVMGPDAVPLPGDVTPGELKRILSDIALLATKANSPFNTRLIPAPGKKAGDTTSFTGPNIFNTTIHPLP